MTDRAGRDRAGSAGAGGRFATEWDTQPHPVYDIWTSVNGSEVVPGVISPLLATTFNRWDHEGLRRLMATYPGGEAVTLAPPPGSNFFGVFGGRLALNNGFSVAAVSALNAEIAQAILQQFFTGASGGERFIIDVDPATRAEAAAAAAAQRQAAPAMLEGWRAALYAERSTSRAARDQMLDLAGSWERWNELWHDNTTTYLNLHYVVSVGAAEYQVALGGVIAAGGGDPNMVVALCSGLGEVESSKPAIRLYELAADIRERPTVRDAFEGGDLDAVAKRLATLSDDEPDAHWQATSAAFREFLFEYGYRGQGEVDPTNPDWAEEPRFVLSQIRSMIAIPPDAAPSVGIQRAVKDREALEAAIRGALPAELHAHFDGALAAAQHFTRLRELSKATWVLAARRTRAPYLAIGRNLVALGVIDAAEHAKFLTHHEIEGLARGDGGDAPTLKGRIEARRRQTQDAEGYRLPDNWVGVAQPTPRGDVDTAATTLTGLGVSIGAGPVTGKARIIPSAEAGLARDLDPGDILVAPFTDAPWTPLFIVAGAVVVETGGVLSHAATVAREFGIPAVVMVPDATRVLADGDTVSVDGATGTITVLERA